MPHCKPRESVERTPMEDQKDFIRDVPRFVEFYLEESSRNLLSNI
jgi:hypothetical protein